MFTFRYPIPNHQNYQLARVDCLIRKTERGLLSGYSQNSLAGGDGEVLEQLDDAFITRKSSIEVVYPLAKQQ
jgi:hypothetical protein